MEEEEWGGDGEEGLVKDGEGLHMRRGGGWDGRCWRENREGGELKEEELQKWDKEEENH